MEKKEESILRYFEHIDWLMMLPVFSMLIVGLLLIFSATLRTGNAWSYIVRQGFGMLIGAGFLLIIATVDYRIYRQYFTHIYFLSVILLVAVLIIGKTYRGTKGWIDLGYLSFQPSELTKIFFILSIAGYLDKFTKEIHIWQKLIIPVLMLSGNIIPILIQPDFSSTLVYFAIFLGMCYASGSNVLHLSAIVLFGFISFSFPLVKTLFIIDKKQTFLYGVLSYHWELALALVAVALFLLFIWWFLKRWKFYVPLFYFIITFFIIVSATGGSYFVGKSIKEYQKKRLVVFINPGIDSLGSGYNIIQSQIAVGSGKVFGKGLFAGTQAQLGFVPAQHTDFIFSLLAEELGFIFTTFVIIFYGIFVWRCFIVSRTSRDKYGAIVSTGIAVMFAFYGITNMGMVVGLAPITGLPLPFFSYGGSSIVTTLISVGIILSIYIRRYRY